MTNCKKNNNNLICKSIKNTDNIMNMEKRYSLFKKANEIRRYGLKYQSDPL